MTTAAPPSPLAAARQAAFAAAGPGEVLLDVEDVCLRLGGNQILEKVSFEVKDRVRPGTVTGQVVGLLGPSGVGKTRLIRLIAGLDGPTPAASPESTRQPLKAGSVGVVFQDYPLLRHRTVLGNLVVAGICQRPDPQGGRRQGPRSCSSGSASATALGFYPAQLSGGQRQRVAIAQQMCVRSSSS